MFKIGVFGIVLNKKREVLLVKRADRDIWNLPGGGLNKGETPEKGLIREVKEETGLLIKIKTLLGIYSKPQKNEIIFSFLCLPIKGKLTLNEEATEFKYFPLDALPTNLLQKQRERILDINKFKGIVIRKTQFDV